MKFLLRQLVKDIPFPLTNVLSFPHLNSFTNSTSSTSIKHRYRAKVPDLREIMARDLESGGGGTKNNRTAEENYSAPESSHVYDSETHWTSWLVPMFVVANIAVFVITMYINNCPRNNLRFQGRCVARFLGRFSFQPMQENPLLGPSSSTYELNPLCFSSIPMCYLFYWFRLWFY